MTPAEAQKQSLRLERTFAARRDDVFRAWTDPESLRQWWFVSDEYRHELAEMDLRAGGRYRLGMRHVATDAAHVVGGVFREVRVPEMLVYTWAWEGAEAAPPMLVTVEFFDQGASTRLVLTHAELSDGDSRANHEKGWIGCLAQLEKLLGS